MYKAFIFLVFYLPFQLAINPVQGIDLASIRIYILSLFFVWLAQSLKNKTVWIPANKESLLVLSFLCINGLSIIMSKNPDWSLRKLVFLYSIFPIYFISIYLVNNKKRLFAVLRAIVFSGGVVAFIGTFQFIAQFVVGLERVYTFWVKFVIMPFLGSSFGEAVLKNPSWLVNISGKTYLRATSIFPDPHMFSFYLGLIFPLAIGLAKYERKKIWDYIGLSGLIFLADILTFSRGGYLGLSMGVFLLIIFFWKKIDWQYRMVMGTFLGIISIILFFSSPVTQRFESSFNLKEGSNQGRLEMWKKAVGIIQENPWLGVGLGNYPLAVKATADYREPIYAHNTYLDIAVETGMLNMLIWISFIGVASVNFWRKSKQREINFFILVSMVIFAIHSLVETALYSPVVSTLFLIIISFSQLKANNETAIKA